jgi:predicted ATPase/DNA-binding CsgD family transcriptional regulator
MYVYVIDGSLHGVAEPVESTLPLDIATFVGREAELAQAQELLAHVRLLTLTGPGGVGKTRLAVQIATKLLTSVRGDAWMIDLGALNDAEITPEHLYARMALALGIRHHGPAGLDVVLTHLRPRRALLLLDNCEHLIPVARACVTALLRAAPNLRILATSRQRLRIDGEHTLVVPSLPLPEAVKLFTAHACASGAAVPADDSLVAELCRRLDGLPLAVRLAAGRARTLSIGQLLELLDDRFRLLADPGALPTDSDSEQRHSTMERVVSLSYRLCTPAEQRLWQRASVFARSFDLPALEAVCAGDGIDPAQVIDLVTGLADKSVLAVENTITGPARYYLLDTLREYGLRKLVDAGDLQRVRDAHRDHYCARVAEAAVSWLGSGELDVIDEVHNVLPDVLAAIDECITQRDMARARAICRDLVRARVPFFWGFLDLARQQLGRVMTSPGEVTSAEQAVDLAVTAATAAWVAVTQGRHEDAQLLLDTAHQLGQRWKLPPLAPVLFAAGGSAALGAGSPSAIGLLAQARSSFTGMGAAADEHMATMMWAMATTFAGEVAAATAAADEYLRQAEDAQAPWALSWALWTAALAALRSGHHHKAADYLQRGLRLQRDMDDHWGQTWSIELCAWIIAAALDQATDPSAEAGRAAWLLGAAQARQEKLGVTLAGLRPLADRHARAYDQLAAVLDKLALAQIMAAGARQPHRAVQVALGEPTPRHGSATGERLTPRELEVASLITKGRTSGEIGAELRIGRRTVDVHVGNIMKKLGFTRRAAIAAWVTAQHPERT